MEDILSISIIEKIPQNIYIFKNTSSLINGSRYLMNMETDEIMQKIYGENEINSWNIISSLNLLFSIKDVIYIDIEDNNLSKEKWENSKWKIKVEEDVLLKILREIRNHNIHIEVWSNPIKNQKGYIGNKSLNNWEKIDLGNQVFFEKIDFSKMQKLKNVKRYKSIKAEDIEWFNRQSTMYSASDLISEARKRYSNYISEFINEEIINEFNE